MKSIQSEELIVIFNNENILIIWEEKLIETKFIL